MSQLVSLQPKYYFVTGTDTEVGKTFISCALLHQAAQLGLTTAAYKPVAAGCETSIQGLRNEDALMLQQASTQPLAYQDVNPIALAPAVAPHLAARQVGSHIGLEVINTGYRQLKDKNADFTLVEGAGGWRLPLNDNQYLSDFVVQQQLAVILVVGVKLGCLNHALLTAQAIRSDGLHIAGWVANQLDMSMPFRQDNIDDLKVRLKAPFLGQVPQLNKAQEAAPYLDLALLI